MSFDVLPDQLGDDRTSYPLTCYIVAGTQAQRAHTNSVIVMKMGNLHRNKEAKPAKEDADEKSDSDSDSDSEDDSDADKAPELEAAMIKHTGSVNRIRVCMQQGVFARKFITLVRRHNFSSDGILALITYVRHLYIE